MIEAPDGLNEMGEIDASLCAIVKVLCNYGGCLDTAKEPMNLAAIIPASRTYP
jgi:hypothetical protein